MSLRNLKREMLPGLLNIPGVRGVGGSEEHGKFKVYVQGSPGYEVIPEVIGGYTVEIHEVGHIKALSMLEMEPLAISSERQVPWRPAPGGVSAGHFQVTAGTIGMAINKGGKLYDLGNNHTFANSDRIGHATARLYDPILQPGVFDGGADPNDRLGTLYSWRPLDEAAHNHVDWALLDPTSQDLLSTEILGVGQPAGVKQAEVGMNVVKSGRTSAVTSGTITDVGADLIVDYEGFSCLFMDQIMTTYMADGGDSGSVLIDPSDNKVVGLCFSGSNLVTLSNHIGLVMNDIMATGIGPAAVTSFSWAPVMIVLAGIGIALILR